MNKSALVPLLIVTGLVAGCGGQRSAPASSAPSAVVPTPIQPTATATDVLATATAVPPATSTPPPTATPRPSLASPLTGLPGSGAEAVTRRPLLVKLGNSEAERPQSGLTAADVVYESLTEGGITRYAAVFQSRDAATVGPVRSARLSDLQLAPEFQAVLAHVGASDPIMKLLHASGIADLDQFFWSQYYQRISARAPPFNVYTSTQQLWTGAHDRGFGPIAQLAGYAFEAAPPSGGHAGTIDFNFAGETHAQYVYQPAIHAYRQIENGQPTIDAATGQPVPIGNVIVQFAPIKTTAIVEDENGAHSIEFELIGQGKAAVFHDGVEVDGTWKRASAGARTSFVDGTGQPIHFARGSVWIALVTPDTLVTVGL